jgi:hypothetical protein
MNLFFFLFNIVLVSSFINIPFGPKFKISTYENKKSIIINNQNETIQNQKNYETIQKINGFYGLIGPDINIKSVSNIYELFTADGLIQGLFFENGNITYVKNFIRTEKLLYEEENGKIPKNNMNQVLFEIFNKINLLPNLLGVANTALFKINNQIYALYERDFPYELNIDFEEKAINTISKKTIKAIPHFSAHSKYDSIKKTIQTLDYNILTNSVSYYELTTNFNIIKHKNVKMKYLPIIHDFWSLNNSIIIIDSPLFMNFGKLFNSQMPVILNQDKNSIIRVLNKKTLDVSEYQCNESFYMFHYANCRENETHIDIFASLYDAIDFSELNIKGNYRQISINKESKKATIIKNTILEAMDLEFPVLFGNKTLFRSMKNKINNGFVVCDDLNIEKEIIFEDRFIAGEPSIINIDGVFHLICFCFKVNNNKNSYLLIINLNTYEEVEIALEESITLGFHSIFIENNNS